MQAISRQSDSEFVQQKFETELLLEENRLKLAKMYFSSDATKCKVAKSLKIYKNYKVSQNKSIGYLFSCKSYGYLTANCKFKKSI